MINYTNVCFYFDINDKLSENIFNKIVSVILENNRLDVNDSFEAELNKLMTASEHIENDDAFSQAAYNILYKHAFDAGVDVTPILFDILLEHDLMHLINIEHNDGNIIKHASNVFNNTIIDQDNYLSLVETFLMKQSKVLEDLPYNTFLQMAKKISLGSNDIQVVRDIFTEFYNRFPPKEKDYYNDVSATVRTLSKYGGTFTQAKELMKKYL